MGTLARVTLCLFSDDRQVCASTTGTTAQMTRRFIVSTAAPEVRRYLLSVYEPSVNCFTVLLFFVFFFGLGVRLSFCVVGYLCGHI